MKFYNVPNIIPASTVMNTTINSAPKQLLDSYIFDIQVFFTGTPTGTFHLEASNDPAAESVARGQLYALPTNWTTIANSTFTVAAAGNVEWDYSWPGFNWVRVVYTDGSGGTSTAIITSCTFNAKG
jgi:hypothetical protein